MRVQPVENARDTLIIGLFLFDISSPPKSFLQEETDPFHKFPRVEPHECVEVTVR
jgi:hypothetical protein